MDFVRNLNIHAPMSVTLDLLTRLFCCLSLPFKKELLCALLQPALPRADIKAAREMSENDEIIKLRENGPFPEKEFRE